MTPILKSGMSEADEVPVLGNAVPGLLAPLKLRKALIDEDRLLTRYVGIKVGIVLLIDSRGFFL